MAAQPEISLQVASDKRLTSKCFDWERFINPGEETAEFQCAICHGVCESCVSTKCGHLFGEQCLVSWIKTEATQCPVCRDTFDTVDRFTAAHWVRRKVMALEVRCTKNECDWTGTLKKFEQEHVTECPFIEVRCRYCKNFVRRQDMPSHLDECSEGPVECDDCGRKGIRRRKLSNHKQRHCIEARVECDLGCGALFKRNQLKTHKKQFCPNRLVECPFAELGCPVTHVKACELAEHIGEFQGDIALPTISQEEVVEPPRRKAKRLQDSDYDDYLLWTWMILFLGITLAMMWSAGFITSLMPPHLRTWLEYRRMQQLKTA